MKLVAVYRDNNKNLRTYARNDYNTKIDLYRDLKSNGYQSIVVIFSETDIENWLQGKYKHLAMSIIKLDYDFIIECVKPHFT